MYFLSSILALTMGLFGASCRKPVANSQVQATDGEVWSKAAVDFGRPASGSAKAEFLSANVVDLYVIKLDTLRGPPAEVGVLTREQILAQQRVVFEWREADHSHTYEFGERELGMIGQGEIVIVSSSKMDGHSHLFMVNPNYGPNISVNVDQ